MGFTNPTSALKVSVDTYRGLNTLFNDVATVMTIALPLIGVLIAGRITWSHGAGFVEIAACGVMYVLTFVGVEVGFHRHFAHRSFRATQPVRAVLAVLGSMAMQGSLIWWAGVHRIHHVHADRPGDPHSPMDGFVHAHVGWLFRNLDPPGWRTRSRDLFRDPIARKATRAYHFLGMIGFLAPAAAVGLAKHSWTAVGLGFLWGGLVRIFLVNHVIWSINSVCHRFGSCPYGTKDNSRNNAYLALPSLGFSWHNNHHAYPGSAINSHRWWQIDPCGALILSLKSLGLTWDVRTATGARDGDTVCASTRVESDARKNARGVRVLIITEAEVVDVVREVGVELLSMPAKELMKTPLSPTGTAPATHWICKNYFPEDIASKIASYPTRDSTEIIVGGEVTTAQVLARRGLRRIA